MHIPPGPGAPGGGPPPAPVAPHPPGPAPIVPPVVPHGGAHGGHGAPPHAPAAGHAPAGAAAAAGTAPAHWYTNPRYMIPGGIAVLALSSGVSLCVGNVIGESRGLGHATQSAARVQFAGLERDEILDPMPVISVSLIVTKSEVNGQPNLRAKLPVPQVFINRSGIAYPARVDIDQREVIAVGGGRFEAPAVVTVNLGNGKSARYTIKAVRASDLESYTAELTQ